MTRSPSVFMSRCELVLLHSDKMPCEECCLPDKGRCALGGNEEEELSVIIQWQEKLQDWMIGLGEVLYSEIDAEGKERWCRIKWK